MSSLYNQKQWNWIADRYLEGYTLKQLAGFLGCHVGTVANNLRQRGVLPSRPGGLPDLSIYRKTFYGLADPGGGADV